MRLSVAIDRFLAQMEVERDWTPRSIDSYGRVLRELVLSDGEVTLDAFEGRRGTERLREFLAWRYGGTSATTRATRISYIRSFFAWAEAEDLILDDPARRLQRPPKRKPQVTRATAAELRSLVGAASDRELPPLLLMAGAGLRASETVRVVWGDLDLGEGLLSVRRKGQKWQRVPLDPPICEALVELHARLSPSPGDHVFTAEMELWRDSETRERRAIDPRRQLTEKALYSMVTRVAARAGLRRLGPHSLRRGFADALIRDTRQSFGVPDVFTAQYLLGHERLQTTQGYLSDQQPDEVRAVLRRLRHDGVSQTPGLAGYGAAKVGFALMEAAGIEPASADAPTERLQA